MFMQYEVWDAGGFSEGVKIAQRYCCNKKRKVGIGSRYMRFFPSPPHAFKSRPSNLLCMYDGFECEGNFPFVYATARRVRGNKFILSAYKRMLFFRCLLSRPELKQFSSYYTASQSRFLSRLLLLLTKLFNRNYFRIIWSFIAGWALFCGATELCENVKILKI